MLKRVSLLGRSAAYLVLFCISGPVVAARPTPNVILFMADDMGLGDTSAYQDFTGNSDADQLATPQMERLARMGVRFTDAHTPSSRCTPTRYALLTGRDPWRTRLKHFVLYGSQGDPLIEADRPTLGTLFQQNGYRTGMVGKWHVGLRYRQSDGRPAAAWLDADMTQPLLDGPLDHGFDAAWFTSRSHGTSGPDGDPLGSKGGPGHIENRLMVTATGPRTFTTEGPDAYELNKLGSRHSDHAIEFLNAHAANGESATKPFFLYYPSNSNHGPYTPDESIAGEKVAGAGRTKDGSSASTRLDYVYENDVALGRLLDWLDNQDDPRWPGHALSENTVVIFTSDNGAERSNSTCTGPFRSNKSSCYEGGHRVPFLVSWPAGGVGNGDDSTPGLNSPTLTSHSDLFATFSDLLNEELPNLTDGEKGAEDSYSVLPAWQGESQTRATPLFVNDHKEARQYGKVGDPAVLAMRIDNPVVDGEEVPGQWKVFFGANLLRRGQANPRELYNLADDPQEQNNLVKDRKWKKLLAYLAEVGTERRSSGGQRISDACNRPGITFSQTDLANAISDKPAFQLKQHGVSLTITAVSDGRNGSTWAATSAGLGLSGGESPRVDSGEAIIVTADQDILVESIHLFAGEGACGGFYQIGKAAPLSIYCSDADAENEGTKDQTGIMHDFGVLKAGTPLKLAAAPFLGVESPGSWTIRSLRVRPLNE
ncbi:MAG: hypothetical protein CMJ47_02215 [Planctomyces sp.]|nr:hypothetical protein [Planctomyces sp.]